jgi:polyhydroxybutyrate depolymerase
MKFMKKILLLLAAFAFTNYTSGQEDSITHDGLIRTYRLHIPAGYDPDSLYPLVINMHGLGSNAFEQEIYTEFDNVADTGGFVVVYPNGIGGTWNISQPSGTDDVGFISALIDTVSSQHNIDSQRVYATGMSMGGFMSYRLACELSDRIAAIASVAGLQAFSPCNPVRPVPVVHFHGTADEIVPYIGVPSTIANWVGFDACPADPVVTNLPDIDTTDNSTVTIYYYGPCEESTEVILYTINNGGHTWPGATIIIGVTNQDIKASNEIWQFFRKFTLQGSTGLGHSDRKETACSFYPNPVHGMATAELPAEPACPFDFRIMDLTGKQFLELRNLSDRRFLIDCSRVPPGLYIGIFTDGKSSSYQKIIIR